MINVLEQVIKRIEVREAMVAPLTCAMCWNYPATEGALCADCLYDPHTEDC